MGSISFVPSASLESVIELYALDAERALTGDLAGLPGLLPLVPFMRGGEQLATIERAAQLLQERVSDPEHQLIAETLLIVLPPGVWEKKTQWRY